MGSEERLARDPLGKVYYWALLKTKLLVDDLTADKKRFKKIILF